MISGRIKQAAGKRSVTMPISDTVIEVEDVSKVFGAVTALDRVSIEVAAGSVLGLLGHNGAGKTTLVNILTTLLPPTSGSARVAGFDVTRHPHEVRARIGLTGQLASVDELISGRDNLVLIGRLLGAGRHEARRRSDELLEVFALTDAATRAAKTYSGGMRRRLDLAACLVGRPRVIFLDEPTTGLDPVSRMTLWTIVDSLVADGAGVLLTTQYLNEAERLAGAITVLASGRVVANGTPAHLKAQVGGRSVHVTLPDRDALATAAAALHQAGLQPALHPSKPMITAPAPSWAALSDVVRALDVAGAQPTEVSISEPTLDDVYLQLTTHSARKT
jgi:ABC-2 type transport system ATP-binding protein